jgi:hypothetical protein
MPQHVHAIAVQIEQQKTRAELRRLWAEFKQTPPGSPERQNRVERIDGLLDARLEQRGAHKADCGCWECAAHVADVLAARRLGELTDPQDVATEGRW